MRHGLKRAMSEDGGLFEDNLEGAGYCAVGADRLALGAPAPARGALASLYDGQYAAVQDEDVAVTNTHAGSTCLTLISIDYRHVGHALQLPGL